MHSECASETGYARACASCHRKKIRCNLESSMRAPCSNCLLHESPCVPRTRKRKHGETSQPGAAAARSEQMRIATVTSPNTPVALDTYENCAQARAKTVDSIISIPNQQRSLAADSASSPEPDPDEVPWSTARVDYEQYYSQEVFSQASPAATMVNQEDGSISRLNTTAPRLHKAFDLPSRVWTSALIENWLNYVHPLMPIVPQRWLVPREGYTVPIVLLKSVLLSGARTSNAVPGSMCKEFYSAVKAMIHCHCEKIPIINIVAACLLGWYNQANVWAVTHDSSRYWLHFASNIAYQIGLHRESSGEPQSPYKRRLWWTLVARDCLLASGHGRPRIFNLKYCSRQLISTQDFEPGDKHAPAFVAYVKICLILGDLCEGYQQGVPLARLGTNIKNRLFWWLKDLPPEMQYFSSRAQIRETADNFILRQLFAIYLATVALLCKADPRSTSVSPVALVASSFMATLFEGFLARNETHQLPAMFAFYVQAAATPQLVARRYAKLRPAIGLDLQTLEDSLAALATRWPSAANALTAFKNLKAKELSDEAREPAPTIAEVQDRLLFEDFDTENCRLWTHVGGGQAKKASHEVQGVANIEQASTEANICPEVLGTFYHESAEMLPPQTFSTGLPASSSDPSVEIPEANFWNDPALEFPDTLGTWLFMGDSFQQFEVD